MDWLIGPGAVGTVLAWYLQKSGDSPLVLVRPSRLADFRAADELQVEFTIRGERGRAPAPPIADAPDGRVPERIFLAMKATDLEAAMDRLGALPPSVVLLPCQNGVASVERVRRRYPENPVHPMCVMFNARTCGPLHATLNSPPLALCNDEGLRRRLSGAGMTIAPWSPQLAWGKLLINIYNAVGALTRSTFNDAARDRNIGVCVGAALREAAATLDAAGIAYELPSGQALDAFAASFEGAGDETDSHFLGTPDGPEVPLFASMVADVEAGRLTEVDEFNGEIVRLGQSVGYLTPVNQKLVELVRAVEGGTLGRLEPAQLRYELAL